MSESEGIPPHRPWLARFTKLVCLATLVLIFLGGQVKSHEAGLSVPDWPNTFGVNMFLFHYSNWVGGIFHEHLHRLVASGIGMLTIILAVWLLIVENRRWVKALGLAALAAVIVQGVLGGLTVLYLLPAPISVAHGMLAQCFLVMLIVIAYTQSVERAERRESDPASGVFVKGAYCFMALVILQLFVGAVMRHIEAALAIPDFPTTAGRIFPVFNAATVEWINIWRLDHGFDTGADLPPVTMIQILIHFAHRLIAVAIAVAAFAATLAALKQKERYAHLLSAFYLLDLLVAIQITLGAFTIWSARTPFITSLHVVTGAAVLAATALLVLRAVPLGSRA